MELCGGLSVASYVLLRCKDQSPRGRKQSTASRRDSWGSYSFFFMACKLLHMQCVFSISWFVAGCVVKQSSLLYSKIFWTSWTPPCGRHFPMWWWLVCSRFPFDCRGACFVHSTLQRTHSPLLTAHNGSRFDFPVLLSDMRESFGDETGFPSNWLLLDSLTFVSRLRLPGLDKGLSVPGRCVGIVLSLWCLPSFETSGACVLMYACVCVFSTSFATLP